MIKRWYLCLLLCWQPFAGLAQESYYATDTLFQSGVKIVDRGHKSNARLCYVVEGKDTLVFTPNNINEYGINGTVYVSAEVNIVDRVEKVFLRRLHQGDVSLYVFQGRNLKAYFIQRQGSPMVLLPKRNGENPELTFRDLLERETGDCGYASQNLKHTRYSPRSLTHFLEKFDQCSPIPFPATRLGIQAGFSARDVSLSKNSYDFGGGTFDFGVYSSWIIGAFIDQPLFYSGFSAHLGANLVQMAEAYLSREDQFERNLVMISTTLEVPFLIRYTANRGKFWPFLNGGGIFSYDLKAETDYYTSFFSQDIIITDVIPDVNSANLLGLGLVAGFGAEYRFSRRNAVSFEMRFFRLNAIKDDNPMSVLLNKAGIQFFTGFSF
ncbi:MAG: outer membrane beta-barrel protein [Bacteroides sp.]|jgi:hypothetical protein|nr:outer membrane beta-barrel protein [Bacteroides sp.]